ncbi:DDHD domain-containing protein [Gamsiella multidivaricata]|uniref:DDHD domain-containing protein n=1 Tax=Gamsiella multidivaricata TaxID=101098 RepID=UPI002220BF10|nr:DDHD domain-containing protein [Gamsiella multidivaricata]KAI7828009.1 DDHD domain-containing protein [Gamsiella multidivaricata]
MSQMPATIAAVDAARNETASDAAQTYSAPSKGSVAKDDSATSSAPSSTKRTGVKPDQYPHHVIFVVHGMGRQLEEFGNYERNVSYLVENTKTVLQSQFHELETDVHIIPIEWHAKLHSMVDQRMALASLRTVPKVRLVMNDYFADILYYFNNHFGAEIIRLIVDELNEAYATFIAKHPDFNGKIAVFALSLGGVAMFDILTCMDDDEPEESSDNAAGSTQKAAVTSEGAKDANSSSTTSSTSEPSKTARTRKQDQPKFRTVVPKLKFRPNILFTVGSPVGAVMVMRNLEWETFHPPDDIVHHNIFHPFDPLAYRLEPLIDPIFAAIPAVTLNSAGNSQLFPISLPSLLPSLPESISSFWENKVPTLPRPTIPALSTLSQMTQSLKAGRWLTGASGGGTTASIGDQRCSVDGATSNESGSESTAEDLTSSNSEGQQREPGTDQGIYPESEWATRKLHQPSKRSHFSQQVDSSVSVTEAIAAATVATYLNEKEGNQTGISEGGSMIDNNINTTTTSPSGPISSPRRPSLGARRISSRVEDGNEDYKPSATAQAANETSPNPIEKVEEADEDAGDEDQILSTTQAADTFDSESIPVLDMEYYLGMETGPTAAEKEQGRGAKSDVVQESIVRSMPSSPVTDSHAHHAHGRERKITSGENRIEDMQAAHEERERAKQHEERKEDNPQSTKRAAVVEDEDPYGKTGSFEQGSDTTMKPGDVDTAHSPIHVGGRETKVPYRIDHVLQETRVDQYTNEYLLGMRSHFRYWGNRDIAYHVLKAILLPGGAIEGGVLDLQPEMPTPVTAPKNVKEAAEAKAKAAAAEYRQSQDLGQRKSFSFSSAQARRRKDNNNRNSSLADADQEQYGGGGASYNAGYGANDEEQLYGYRYADLDMSSAANVPFSTNTLYQSSPFAKNNSGGTSGSGEARYHASSSRAADLTHNDASSSVASTAAGQNDNSPPTAFEEGIVIPDLARPPKLHHRSSRVEERR